MDIPLLNAPAICALTPLSGILEQDRALSVVERPLPHALGIAAASLAKGPAESARFQMDDADDQDGLRTSLVNALALLAKDSPEDRSSRALGADAVGLVQAAWQLRDGLDEIAPLRYRHLPLRVRIERVTSDGCRLFHVDQVALRMICTWHGAGSEWLPEHAFDRSGLGCGCNDHVRDMSAIQRIPTAAVAVMKGDRFPGETGRGLVHRSPPASPDEPRLLMVVDIA